MKEYKRLTKKSKYGAIIADCKGCEDKGKCHIKHDKGVGGVCDCKISHRLFELENDIENRGCIILPFLVGQDAFIIEDDKIVMGVVNGIWWQNEFLIEVRYSKDKYGWSYAQRLKNEIFSTKAEAEAKLKELENER